MQTKKTTAAAAREIRHALGTLYARGGVGELRCFGKRKTYAGFFDDPDAMAEEAYRADERGFDVYVTLNPCKASLLGRADNELVEIDPRRTPLASDKDIERRRWILIDCDQERPAKISATDEEKEQSLERAREIWAWLKNRGIASLPADSGNGAHLLVPVDLPNVAASAALVEGFLKALSFRFSDGVVKVDEGTFNAARITKAYGVHARKGQHAERLGRVHRASKLLSPVGEEPPGPVDKELLEAVARACPEDAARSSRRFTYGADGFDLHQWIAEHDVPVKREGEWANGGYKWVLEECIFHGHADNSAYIVRLPSGAIAAGCHHDSCQTGENRWPEVRQHFEPEAYSQYSQYSQKQGSGGIFGDFENFGNGKTGENVPWEPPAPFYEFDLPDFPTKALPSWAAEFVKAEAEATQTPEDLAGSLVLAVGALALAKVIEVEPWPGWREPVNLFTATAMPPGSRKTRVFKDALAPVVDCQAKAAKDAAPKIARARARYNVYEKRLEKSQKAAASASEDDLEARVEEAALAAEELARLKIPAEPRWLADDASPEKLASMLAEQAGRMALMSPEGDVFDIMAGRYSQGVPNLGVYLKGHAGDALRVDRVERASESVEAPALTIGLAVQPEVLHGLVDKPGFRGRGLLGRFLYGLPSSNLGKRDQEPDPVDDRVRAAYRFSVKTLLALAPDVEPQEELKPTIVKLSEEAKTKLKEFMVWIEPQLAEQGALGSMTDWAGKLAGATVRVAGVLHGMKFVESRAEGTPAELAGRFITADTMSRAIELGNYFCAHARAAFAEMGADPVVEGAKHLLRWIERNGVSEFTKREAFQGTKGRFHKVTEMGPALDLLEAHGHIRVKRSGTKDPRGRGRPSVRYEVNPLEGDKITRISYSQNSQYSQKRRLKPREPTLK
jgi:replicative DNA helicase